MHSVAGSTVSVSQASGSCSQGQTPTALPDPAVSADVADALLMTLTLTGGCGCGDPPAIVDGAVGVSGGTEFGSQVVYSCTRPGYGIPGPAISTCLPTGVWTDTPTCTLTDCGDLSNPANGTVDMSGGTTYGSMATYSCYVGYVISLVSTTTCQGDGMWTDPATCTIQDCLSLSDPANGNVSIPSATTYGSVATYTCATGYSLIGSPTVTCQAEGSWSAAPTCNIKDCLPPREPADGAVETGAGTTYGSVATYSCHVGFQLSGPASITCQVDGCWQDPPTCSPNDCGSTSSPIHGAVDFPGGTAYLSEATYTCNSGYEVIGTPTSTCQADSTWTAAPTCNMKDCGFLSEPVNGAVNMSAGTVYGTTATYLCDLGYDLIGDHTATCTGNGSWSPAPSCRVADCGPPSPPYNGGLDTSTGTTYLSEATYTCSIGYNVIGSLTATCQANGSWTSTPTCNIQDCGTLSSPINGVVDTSNGTTFGSTASYTCLVGYNLRGTPQAECQSNGIWSPAPTCLIKDCGQLTNPTNGLVNTASGTTFGSTATFTCGTGYHVSGPTSATCQAVGSWSATPVCIIEDCGELTHPDDGTVNTPFGSTYGSTATYSCHVGYDVIGTATVMCQATGTWTSPPTCVIIDCGPLSNPTDGTVNTSVGTAYASMATYSCDLGFDIIGVSIATCQADRSWSPAPTCLIGDCGSLSNPSNGIVDTSGGSSVGHVAQYICNLGYYLTGPDTAICQLDTIWTVAPVCSIEACGPLASPTDGSVDPSAGTIYQSVATYTCHAGYVLIGSSTVTCQADGAWTAAPTCRIKDCGSLPNPGNGAVDTSSGTSYGSTAVYTCHAGYYITGTYYALCQAAGTWTSPPTCTIKDCGGLAAPADGTLDMSGGTTYGSVAVYACQPGYTLTGAATAVCQADGHWSSTATACTFTDCGPLTSPANGVVNVSSTLYGSLATYTCDAGYDITGSASVACQADGSWSTEPTCSTEDASSSDSLLVLVGGILGGVCVLAIGAFITAACMYWQKQPTRPTPQPRPETPDLLIEAMPHRLAGYADITPLKLAPREHTMDNPGARLNSSVYIFPGAKSNNFMFKMPSMKEPRLLHLSFSAKKTKYTNNAANHPSPAPVEQTPSVLHMRTIEPVADTEELTIAGRAPGETTDGIQMSVSPATSVMSTVKSSSPVTDSTRHEVTAKTSSFVDIPDNCSMVHTTTKPIILSNDKLADVNANIQCHAIGFKPAEESHVKNDNTKTVHENEPNKQATFSAERGIMEYIQRPGTLRSEMSTNETLRKKSRVSSTVKMANMNKIYSGRVLPKFKIWKAYGKLTKHPLHTERKYNSPKNCEGNSHKIEDTSMQQSPGPPVYWRTTRLIPATAVKPLDIDLI